MKYVIMKSMFGDYWIGKTALELPENAKAFDNFDDAKEEAMALAVLCANRDELEDMYEEDIEDEIEENMFKWLA